MDNYSDFSRFYDILTNNINYKKRAVYFDMLIKKFSTGKNTLLDLACGTGSLSVEFIQLGYKVIGVDASVEMLSVASSKKYSEDILFVNQRMENLQLLYNIDVVVCALDSINHLEDISLVEKTFENISKYLNENGIFIFDINTEYKHEKILSDNGFIFENDDVFCAWQNFYDKKNKKTEIILDFFEENKEGLYERYQDRFFETVYSGDELKKILEKYNFSILGIYSDGTQDNPNKNDERIVYVTRKENTFEK